MPEDLVYIILLNWNGWRNTLECLASLESLVYPNYRIVVVDNGSTDDSVAHIRSAYPGQTLLQSDKNLGFAGGNNVGIRYALEQGARYVWLLNNDTVVDPHALAAMVEVAEADPRVGLVGSVLHYYDDPERVQAWGGGQINWWMGSTRHFIRAAEGRLDYITGASMLIPREMMDRVGLLDETFFFSWEDTDYSVRVSQSGFKLAVADEALVLHKESAAIGKGSQKLDRLFNEAAVHFFVNRGGLLLLPAAIGVMGRCVKRLIRFDIRRAVAVLQGAAKGIRKYSWSSR